MSPWASNSVRERSERQTTSPEAEFAWAPEAVFAVFASDASIDGELRPLTSSGLIPLQESGEISGTGSGVFGGSEGLTLAEALEG